MFALELLESIFFFLFASSILSSLIKTREVWSETSFFVKKKKFVSLETTKQIKECKKVLLLEKRGGDGG